MSVANGFQRQRQGTIRTEHQHSCAREHNYAPAGNAVFDFAVNGKVLTIPLPRAMDLRCISYLHHCTDAVEPPTSPPKQLGEDKGFVHAYFPSFLRASRFGSCNRGERRRAATEVDKRGGPSQGSAR